jgi:integrase
VVYLLEPGEFNARRRVQHGQPETGLHPVNVRRPALPESDDKAGIYADLEAVREGHESTALIIGEWRWHSREQRACMLGHWPAAGTPAVDVELPSAPRPRVRPWEPAELGAFLDSIAADRFAPLFELIAGTGLRRGEAVGLRWADVDLERAQLVVRQQIVGLDGQQAPCPYCGGQHLGAVFGRPKTASGEDRVVELDGGVAGVLLAHRLHQDAERATWGAAYSDHGLVFAREDGTPIAPERVTKRFGQMISAAGLRPIRLHDLRHGRRPSCSRPACLWRLSPSDSDTRRSRSLRTQQPPAGRRRPGRCRARRRARTEGAESASSKPV